ncbi:MAG: hypothetical protein JEZ07_03130 [Phycisphaerae bacterium]|nr:hypothetical protein [Phycisphaerae bacterium]
MRIDKKLVLLVLFLIQIACFGQIIDEKIEELPQLQFDLQRHIDVSEIKEGMKGYGLTVFHGTTIEKFEVEVISVMPGHSAGRSAVLIKCNDPRFDLARGVQGCSGSPVYFKGRLLGAMAFGWEYSEEALYGVTPIKQMLDTYKVGLLSKRKKSKESVSSHFDRNLYANLMRADLLTDQQVAKMLVDSGLAKRANSSDNGVEMPLAWNISGMSSAGMKMLQRDLPGVIFNSTGVGAGHINGNIQSKPKLEPGSSIAVPLLSGDISGAAIGTVTEVIGNHVFAFGHPWNGAGPINSPMATAYIHTIMSSKRMSFKLGGDLEIVGTLLGDETPAVYGQVGIIPEMTDIEVQIRWPDMASGRTFNIKAMRDKKMSASLVYSAIIGALSYRGELFPEVTLEYEVKAQFDGAADMVCKGVADSTFILRNDISSSIALILNNPFKPVKLDKVEVKITLINKNSGVSIVYADIDKTQYAPGETVRTKVKLKGDRQGEKEFSVELKLPADLPNGKYKISIGNSAGYQRMLDTYQKALDSAFDLSDITQVLNRRFELKRDDLYISMALPKQGYTLKDKQLPSLPASKAAMLMDSRRQMPVGKYQEVIVNSIPTDLLIKGSLEYEITVSDK